MKIDNSPPRGTRDLLPNVVAVRDHVLSVIAKVYARYGYERIETPALEAISRLSSGEGADNEKMLYRVVKRGLPQQLPAETSIDDLIDLGLRYDLTVPLTRFYAQYRSQLPSPFRSFQCGPVWRAERPQKGRYRQFVQCDIDVIGEASVLAEIELIEATAEVLAEVGLSDVTVNFSDRRFLTALAGAAGIPDATTAGFFVTLDKLDKIGWDGVARELTEKLALPMETVTQVRATIDAVTEASTDKLIDVLANSIPGLSENVLDDIASLTDNLTAISGLSWRFEPSLVRGMGYYTGPIFEVTHPDSASAVAGGGRYDRLVGRSLGTEVPACGFSIGFERIVDLLETVPKQDRVALVYDTDVPMSEVIALSRTLRVEQRQIATVRRSGKLPAQLTKLEAAGFTSFRYLKAGMTELPPEKSLGASSEVATPSS